MPRSTGRLRRHALILGVILFLPLALPAEARVPDTPPVAGEALTSASLEALNQRFRQQYRARTAQVLASQPLVLVVQNGGVTAVRGTHRTLYGVPLQRYQQARALVHASLATHGVLARLAHQPNEADWQALRGLQHDLQSARQLLPRTQLSREEKQLAGEWLGGLMAAVDSALETKSVNAETLRRTLGRLEPVLMRFSTSVGRAHAQALQETLNRVRADATPEEWAGAVAVVTGPMTARRNNLEAAAVAAVLGPEHLGSRIFYAENIFSVDGALDYLQVVLGDSELAGNLFGEPTRMWQDLFAPLSLELVGEDFYTDLATPAGAALSGPSTNGASPAR